MVFEGFSFSKKHRFLEARKLEKSENELPAGDVWQKLKNLEINYLDFGYTSPARSYILQPVLARNGKRVYFETAA